MIKFTDEQKNFICEQIGEWYLMMKPLLEGQHNLGFMKERLKMMICDYHPLTKFEIDLLTSRNQARSLAEPFKFEDE